MRRWAVIGALLAGCAHAPEDRPTLPSDVSPAAWNTSLQLLLPGLSECRQREKDTSGRVEVHVTVGSNGQPDKVLAFGGVPGPVRDCVAGVFRRGIYPTSRRGPYTYVYPLVYSKDVQR
jgi:hypothetical protein